MKKYHWVTMNNFYWVSIAIIFFIWICAWGYAVLNGINQSNFTSFLLAFGGGLTVICGVMFVGHATRLQNLSKPYDKLIWYGVIIGILTTTSTHFANSLSLKKHISIDNFISLDETKIKSRSNDDEEMKLTEILVRNRSYYKNDNFNILWLAKVSNFQVDKNGLIDISYDVTVIDHSTKYAYKDNQVDRSKPVMWKLPKSKHGNDKIISIVGDISGSTILLGVTNKIPMDIIKPGTKTIRLMVSDKKTGKSAMKEFEITIR